MKIIIIAICQCHLSIVISIGNMADEAIARREVRRRKILANSHNRLQLISGKNDDELPQESQSAIIPDQIYDNKVFKESNNVNTGSLSNGIINPESIPFDLSFTDRENEFGGNHPPNDLAASGQENAELSQKTSLLEKITVYRYDVVFLAMLIQFLYSFSIISFNSTYFFLPLIMHVTTKLIWFPKQNNFNFANALLLLNGISASKAQRIMSITQWIGDITQDICVFLFSTVCIQAFGNYMKEIVN